MRKFEIVTKFKDKNINKPIRQTSGSAGYDFEAAEDIEIPPYQFGQTPTLVHTGIKAKMAKEEVLLLYNRSSNPLKHNLILPNGVGVIDSDYYDNSKNEGEILGQFINLNKEAYLVHKGDRIMQGVFVKYGITIDDKPAKIERSGGFGSTDAHESHSIKIN